MKVRRKCNVDGSHMVYDILEESPSYYIVRDYPQLLSKTDYEPVPEETWRDVTAECSEKANSKWLHDGDLVMFPYQPNYRLRKVDIRSYDDPYHPKWAFIVERKVMT